MPKTAVTKQAALVASPSGAKKPGAKDTPDVIKHEPLSWGLERVDFGGTWGWRGLDAKHIDELHRELVKREGETLERLLKAKEVKDIPAVHMKREAKERLQKLGLEERDTLWELRLPSKRRAWGLMDGAVFQFLWWDPDETACNPPPKGSKRR